jgi:hypothetical protein
MGLPATERFDALYGSVRSTVRLLVLFSLLLFTGVGSYLSSPPSPDSLSAGNP